MMYIIHFNTFKYREVYRISIHESVIKSEISKVQKKWVIKTIRTCSWVLSCVIFYQIMQNKLFKCISNIERQTPKKQKYPHLPYGNTWPTRAANFLGSLWLIWSFVASGKKGQYIITSGIQTVFGGRRPRPLDYPCLGLKTHTYLNIDKDAKFWLNFTPYYQDAVISKF